MGKKKKREISKRESGFLSENNVASYCNVKFYHPKIQDSKILESFLREHVSYVLYVLFLDGISTTGEKMYRTYLKERRGVTFLEELPQTLEVCK